MKHSEHRKQVADIKRTFYRELRTQGDSPSAARKNVDETVDFIDSLQQLAFKYGYSLGATKSRGGQHESV